MLENTLHELSHEGENLEKERGAATESEDPAAAASVIDSILFTTMLNQNLLNNHWNVVSSPGPR